MIRPGEWLLSDKPIEINAGRRTCKLKVRNTGDRPIQIGSHFHFFEVNRALDFDRPQAMGMHLNLPGGLATRFEPGDEREVELVEFGGMKYIVGFNDLLDGGLSEGGIKRALERAKELGFSGMGHADATQAEQSKSADALVSPKKSGKGKKTEQSSSSIPRQRYVDLYGPTVGDRFRLADTELICEVEQSLLVPGDEAVYGGGKTIRDGMGQASGLRNDTGGVLDLVITSVIIMDPILGIIKADIGIKDGLIAGIGKAGNPHLMDGVDPHMVIGGGTEVIAGEGLIATAGAIDTHVHFLTSQQAGHALSNGVTTLIGGGTGPADGSCGVSATPGPWNLARMFEACDEMPVNVGLLAKGNSSRPETLREQIEAGACGLKIHEDYGATASVINCALSMADEYDVQVAIHTDTLNECGYLADTVNAINGRTIHTFHTEGAGGGHAPDIMAIASYPNVLPASTNPTRPFTTDTVDNLYYMTVVCHHLNTSNPEDVAFAQSRIRAETIAAEDVLHDLGAISMFSSDSQAMGRIGESVIRCFQSADKMKRQVGKLKEDSENNDNFRVLRYLAKLTINPAITHGIADHVGSLEKGKLADIVLWTSAMFGVKPKLVVKGGMVNWSIMGDPNASIASPEPVFYRPMFGSDGRAAQRTCLTFMSRAAIEKGVPEKLGLERRVVAVNKTRALHKKDMVRNGALPKIEIDPETYKVYVDGKLATVPPIDEVSMAQRYFIV